MMRTGASESETESDKVVEKSERRCRSRRVGISYEREKSSRGLVRNVPSFCWGFIDKLNYTVLGRFVLSVAACYPHVSEHINAFFPHFLLSCRPPPSIPALPSITFIKLNSQCFLKGTTSKKPVSITYQSTIYSLTDYLYVRAQVGGLDQGQSCLREQFGVLGMGEFSQFTFSSFT